MRRQIIILVLLLMALPLGAQTWPGSFNGEKVEAGEVAEIQMWLQAWNDMTPWGMVDPVGDHFYFGTLEFTVCDDVDVAILDIDFRAYRYCMEPPWGTPDNEDICYYYSLREIPAPSYTLEWNELVKSYISIDWVYWGASVVVLTVKDADRGIVKLQMGTMQLEDGQMIWDETRVHYIYKIEPFVAEPGGPLPRHGGGRRVR